VCYFSFPIIAVFICINQLHSPFWGMSNKFDVKIFLVSVWMWFLCHVGRRAFDLDLRTDEGRSCFELRRLSIGFLLQAVKLTYSDSYLRKQYNI
jgi:hypothetical protein